MIGLTAQDQVNKAIYYKAFFAFGLLPLLLLIDRYEDEQKFDECLFIKMAIDEVNKAYNENLETRWSDAAVARIKKVHDKEGRDFVFYYNDLQNRVKEVEQFVAYRRKDFGLNSMKSDIKNIFNL